jgi:GTP pyrophosphokinase
MEGYVEGLIEGKLEALRGGKDLGEAERRELSREVREVYVPMAHKLGMYGIKGEMEDLVLKYEEPEVYAFIKKKLNETKRSRDAYIEEFIGPVGEKLGGMGLVYTIKGRTKSIYSINNKLKKQGVEFEEIYDLFAIRIILEVEEREEKAACWRVYSMVTGMYESKVSRMRDWISVSKANGYESLHITVLGPGGRWVEVQIRSRRMDEVAEKGVAAHWKYKGVGGKRVVVGEEIYVFTPAGELIQMPVGSTVVDFAYGIHSVVGDRCVSGVVNGVNVPLRQVLRSGDKVKVVTSSVQRPRRDWLGFVVTGRARSKIKQGLREQESKGVEEARETLKRRFKNRKIEVDESAYMRYVKRCGYKTLTEFYEGVSCGKIDINGVIEGYLEEVRRIEERREVEVKSVEGGGAKPEVGVAKPEGVKGIGEELLFEGKDIKGLAYKLASCCNPERGDAVFGFISTQGIRVHRMDCPNAVDMRERFPQRVIVAGWGRGVSEED